MFHLRGPRFGMRGGRKAAKPAGGSPLDRWDCPRFFAASCRQLARIG